MRRRTVLRALGGMAALGSAGVAGAHPKGAGTGQSTPPSETPIGPDPLGTLSIEGAKEAIVRDETTAFLATTTGFAVVDVSDPAEPTVTYRTDSVLEDHEDGPLRGVWDVTVEGDRLLVVGPAYGGFDSVHAAVVFDVTDPADPRRVAVHETKYPIHNSYLADGVAFLTGNGADGNPLVTVDAASGEELGRWSLFDDDEAWRDVASPLRVLHDVWVEGDHAYLAHWDAGTWILDVSDPSTPAVVSRVRGRPAAELAAVENTSKASESLPGNDHFVTADDTGSLLGIGVEAWASDERSDRGPGGIHLYDISDPTAPEKRAHIEPPLTPDPTRQGVWTTAHNFELVDERLYSAWYQGGVKVHNVSDPAAPVELFHWRDADRAKFWTAQLGVPGDFFVASSWETPGEEDGPGGLFTFPDPSGETAKETEDGPVGASGAGLGILTGLGSLTGLGLGALGIRAWRDRR